ncbi:MAG TPA: GNAT family protein [Draconibacterium sp.]|nr:GNAT family protein [Draconibacterium sp.]
MEHISVNDKIRLERIKLSMAPEIFAAIDHDRIYLKQWLPFVEMTLNVQDTERFINSVTSDKKYKRDEIFSIRYHESFAGLIGFKDTDWNNRKTELGYWLAEELQGKGIITTCVKKLISFAFVKMKLNRVQIKVAVGNHKSEAIPNRLGFQLEGIERAGEFHENKYLDLKVFSLLKKDWLALV